MAITLPKENDFELTPAGTHIARCYRVVDFGTQEMNYNGEVKHARQVQIGWEIPEEKMTDGRPFTISQRYTLSSSKKSNLRKMLEAWRGKSFTKEELGSFDITKLVGAPAMIGVIHTDGENTYANISSVSGVPKGTVVPELINEPIRFSLSEFDEKEWAKLHEKTQEKIVLSPEYKTLTSNGASGKEVPLAEDDLPF